MNVVYISELAALTGSAIGGMILGVSTWLSGRVQARSALLGQEKSRREDLYRDFIITASRVYANALMHDEPQIPDIVALYALISRMRILSTSRIVACAEQTTHTATEAYFMPNKTIHELHDVVTSEAINPLKEFSEAARDELRTICAV